MRSAHDNLTINSGNWSPIWLNLGQGEAVWDELRR